MIKHKDMKRGRTDAVGVRLPWRCRTPDGRNRIVGYLSQQVQDALRRLDPVSGARVLPGPGMHPTLFEIERGPRMALVEIGTEQREGSVFYACVWVNGKNTTPKDLARDVTRALEEDDEDA